MQVPVSLNGAYATQPNDQYIFFNGTWNTGMVTEHRLEWILMFAAAWPYSTGEDVTIAVGDCGIELNHPELVNRAMGGPHFNFANNSTNATPFGSSSAWAHGTEVAGLALAEANNSVGVAGVAPKARLASWVIQDTNLLLVTDEQLMDMYQYESNKVSVQNHSWSLQASEPSRESGRSRSRHFPMQSPSGRNGRGVVIVRAAGNDRLLQASADDDGYPSNPRVIAVGAVRIGGRVATFSEFGASILVAAPSGDKDSNEVGLFTTDLLGSGGVNVAKQ